MIELTVELRRKDPGLPVYFEVPSIAIPWQLEGTTTVEVTLAGVSAGRRSLKPWTDEKWFIDVPKPVLEKVGATAGDHVAMTLRLASTALPTELSELIRGSPQAASRWQALSASRQRALREHVGDAKKANTRRSRARRALAGDDEAEME